MASIDLGGIAVPEAALTFKFVRASGPGGQNINKVSTAVEGRLDLDAAGLRGGLRGRLERLAGSRLTAAGEIVVRRGDEWFPTKDLGRADEDGFFYHAGRADDVIISAGWTMSAVEIEDALLRHPDVSEIAVIGVPDALRGRVFSIKYLLNLGVGALAVPMIAVLHGAGPGFAGVFTVLAALAACLVAVALMLPGRGQVAVAAQAAE